MPQFSADELINVAAAVLEAAGAPANNARTVAQLLTEANQTGHDSHGVIRLPQYLQAVDNGDMVPDAEVTIPRENPITAVVDGNWGFGQVTMTRAVDLGLEKARKSGLAAVAVRGANHIGRVGSYADRSAREGMAAVVFVNAVGIPAYRMAPWGGTESRLATDPMAVGIPAPGGDPVVIDMTTTVVAEGKVRLKRNRGEQTPDGWLQDAEGNPTTDPRVLYEAPYGSILPLGGATAGHKGYGLNVAIELLGGVLSGTGCVTVEGRLANGVLLILLDVEQFMPIDEYFAGAQKFIEHVKSSPLAAGVDEILLPGEIEQKVKRQRDAEGIYVEEETCRQVLEWGDKLGVELDLKLS
jgi:uncharacterized oxidoreductase